MSALTARILTAAAVLAPLCYAHPLLEDFSQLPQSVWLQSAAWAALAAALWGRRKLDIPAPALWQALAGLLAWCAASTLWAHNFYEALLPLTRWTACAAAALAAALSFGDAAARRRLQWALTGLGAAVSLLGILQYGGFVAGVAQVLPPAATLAHRNIAAVIVALTLPFALAAWIGEARRAPAALAALGAGLGIAYLYCAGSRTAMLTAAAALVVFAGLAARRRAMPRRAAVGALLLLPLLAATRLTPHQRAPSDTTEERLAQTYRAVATGDMSGVAANNIRQRFIFWRNTLEMIKTRPLFGVGLGNHKVHYPRFSRAAVVDEASDRHTQLTHTHNDYLQLTAETGAIGLLLLTAVLWALLGAARAALRKRGRPEDALPPAAAAAALCGGGVAMAGSFPLQTALAPFLLALCAGLLAAQGGARALKFSVRPAAAGAAALAALSLLLGGARLAAEAAYTRGRAAALRGDWPRAVAEQEAAYRRFPLRKRARFAAATGYAQRGDFKRAAAILEDIAAAYPYHLNTLDNLGAAYAASGRPHKAVEAYDRLLKIKPDDARGYFGLSRLFARYGDKEKSYRTMLKAAEHAPEESRYQLMAAQMAAALGEPETARALLRRTLSGEMDPETRRRAARALKGLPAAPRAK